MRGDRRQPFVLVADDDRDTRELYRACFDTSGYRTAEAGTGSQAIVSAVEIVPDVLLTDYVLPDVDGLTIARHLKADRRRAPIRFQPLRDRDSVHVRQDVVREQEVGYDFHRRHDRLRAGAGLGRTIAIRVETRTVQLAGVAIVIRDQNERRAAKDAHSVRSLHQRACHRRRRINRAAVSSRSNVLSVGGASAASWRRRRRAR